MICFGEDYKDDERVGIDRFVFFSVLIFIFVYKGKELWFVVLIIVFLFCK